MQFLTEPLGGKQT